MNLILLFGVIVFLGTFGSRLAQRLHVPQVVGCVLIGVILGGDLLNVIDHDTVKLVEPFTMLALGFIGFMIGGELKAEIFKKHGKQFFVILFSQGLGTFFLVMAGMSIVVWLITGNILLSIAISLLFGAIASATAPAATTNVLWEYKTRGPLTAAVLAIVALDDALALLLYKGAITAAEAIMGMGESSVLMMTLELLGEILAAVLLGFLAGILLNFLLKVIRSDERILGFSIALLLLVVGTSILLKADPILPTMTFGITIANLARQQSKSIFGLVRKFTPPIYTAFFVLAGAHISFGSMTVQMAIVTVVYILLRASGKIVGTWYGARKCNAPEAVRKYLGICLLPQAGVAIGLAILAAQFFREINEQLSQMIIIVVMTGTFIIEIIGPMLVKIGVKKAGEVGLNITEEDLIKTHTVADVMKADVPVIQAGLSFGEIIKVVSETDSSYYSVVDSKNKLIGAVTLESIKNIFLTQEFVGDWLIALDIMEPIVGKLTQDNWLSDAFEQARRFDVEYLPVVSSLQEDRFVGILDCRSVRRSLSAEVLARQQKADRAM